MIYLLWVSLNSIQYCSSFDNTVISPNTHTVTPPLMGNKTIFSQKRKWVKYFLLGFAPLQSWEIMQTALEAMWTLITCKTISAKIRYEETVYITVTLQNFMLSLVKIKKQKLTQCTTKLISCSECIAAGYKAKHPFLLKTRCVHLAKLLAVNSPSPSASSHQGPPSCVTERAYSLLRALWGVHCPQWSVQKHKSWRQASPLF